MYLSVAFWLRVGTRSICPFGMVVHPSEMPQPGAGENKVGGACVRHTTPENIRTFFDPTTYQKTSAGVTGIMPPPGLQKRPLEQDVNVPRAKARMEKSELIEKFKLAAALNGLTWTDIIDLWFLVRESTFFGNISLLVTILGNVWEGNAVP